MITVILSIIFYSCSGIFDAIMDTLKDHYVECIFKGLNPQFWNPLVSWKNKYINADPSQGHKFKKILGIKINFPPDAFSDAWHTCKTIREGFNILAILSLIFVTLHFSWTIILGTFICLAIFRNLSFMIFYNLLLIKK